MSGKPLCLTSMDAGLLRQIATKVQLLNLNDALLLRGIADSVDAVLEATEQPEDDGCSFGRRVDPDTLANICDTHGKVCAEQSKDSAPMDGEREIDARVEAAKRYRRINGDSRWHAAIEDGFVAGAMWALQQQSFRPIAVTDEMVARACDAHFNIKHPEEQIVSGAVNWNGDIRAEWMRHALEAALRHSQQANSDAPKCSMCGVNDAEIVHCRECDHDLHLSDGEYPDD